MELLKINEDFSFHLNNPRKASVRDFELLTFTQTWGNTSGGFERAGGCAMTSQRTYVFIPITAKDENCLVFFGGSFAYAVPYSNEFMNDVRNSNVAGCKSYGRYLENK